MIKIELKELLTARGRSIYWLSRATGVRWSTLAKLAKGKTQRLELPVLGLICEVLGCEVSDVLVVKPKASKKKRQERRQK